MPAAVRTIPTGVNLRFAVDGLFILGWLKKGFPPSYQSKLYAFAFRVKANDSCLFKHEQPDKCDICSEWHRLQSVWDREDHRLKSVPLWFLPCCFCLLSARLIMMSIQVRQNNPFLRFGNL